MKRYWNSLEFLLGILHFPLATLPVRWSSVQVWNCFFIPLLSSHPARRCSPCCQLCGDNASLGSNRADPASGVGTGKTDEFRVRAGAGTGKVDGEASYPSRTGRGGARSMKFRVKRSGITVQKNSVLGVRERRVKWAKLREACGHGNS